MILFCPIADAALNHQHARQIPIDFSVLCNCRAASDDV